jgi:hypothetical protein
MPQGSHRGQTSQSSNEATPSCSHASLSIYFSVPLRVPYKQLWWFHSRLEQVESAACEQVGILLALCKPWGVANLLLEPAEKITTTAVVWGVQLSTVKQGKVTCSEC